MRIPARSSIVLALVVAWVLALAALLAMWMPLTVSGAPLAQTQGDGTTIDPVQNTDGTWGPGTITATADVTIQTGVTINIAPGTIVRVADNVGFWVEGDLHSDGPVTFSGISGTPGAWTGITYAAGSRGFLTGATVEHARHALTLNTANAFALTNSTLRYNLHATVSSSEEAYGAALVVLSGSPLISATEIYSNAVRAGGGASAYGGAVDVQGGAPQFVASRIHDNSATATSNSGAGGGMSVRGGAPTISGGEVTTNTIVTALNVGCGGGIGIHGVTGATVRGNRIAGNRSAPTAQYAAGGGICLDDSAQANLIDANLVANNVAIGPAHGEGGGIDTWANNVVTVTNNLLFGNVSSVYGGAMLVNGAAGNVRVFNNTIVGNSSNEGGGLYVQQQGVVANNVLVNNSASSSNGGGGIGRSISTYVGARYDNNVVWHNTAAGASNDYNNVIAPDTNVTADPLFVGTGNLVLRYHLRQGSPAIDAGATGPSALPDHDYDGNVRPRGTGPDAGFDEVEPFTVTKSVDAAHTFGGGRLTYTIVLSNPDALSTLVGGRVTDVLPAPTAFDTGPTCNVGGCGYDGIAKTITWTGDIAANGVLTLTFDVRAGSGLTDGTGITNAATLAAGAMTSSTNIVTSTVYSLGFRQIVTPTTNVAYRSEVTWTVTLSNSSPSDATGALVTDTLPAGVTFARWVESPSGSTESSGRIDWNGTIPAGQALTWSWVTTHTGSYNDVITNTAWFAHPATDTDGQAKAAFAVIGAPALSLGKSVSPDADVAYHGEVTYTVTLTNAGPSDAAGVLLSDTLPARVAFARWVASPSGTGLTDGRIDWAGTAPAGQVLTWSWVTMHTGSYNDVITNTAWFAHPATDTDGQAKAAFAVIGAPALTLGKSVSPDVDVTYHGEVTYTVTLTNAGPSDAAGVLLSDTLPAGVTFARWVASPSGTGLTDGRIDWNETIPAGQALTWTWVATHTGAYGDVIANTAQYAHPDSGAAGSVGAVFAVIGAPALTLGKSVSPDADVAYHGEVTYTVTLTNAGPSDAAGVLLSDTLPAGLTFARWVASPLGTGLTDGRIDWNGTIPAGQVLTWSWVMAHAGSYGDVIANTARYAHPDSGAAGSAEAVFQVIGAPALSLGKSVSPDADVAYHGEVTYTVTLTNAGPSDAAGVLLSDTLPAGLTFARWIASLSGTSLTDGRIDWNGTIPAGQVLTWSWVTTHTGGYGDVIANTAQYGHSDSGAAGSAGAVFAVIGAPALTLGKAVSPDADVAYHGEVTYTVALTNAGPSDAAGVLLSDTLPAGLTFARWVASPLGTGLTDGRIDWNGTIPAGQVLTWSWVMAHAGSYGDVIANTARYAHPDSGAAGSAEAVFQVIGAPALTLGKSVSPDADVAYHGEVTYTVALTNAGPSDAAGVLLSDTLPAGVTFARWVASPLGTGLTDGRIDWNGTIPAGQALTWSWVTTHTGSYNDVITNTAWFAHPATDTDGQAKAAFAVIGAPALTLGKSVSPDVDVTYHGEVTYTVALTNAGPSDAAGVLLSDTLPAGLTFARWVASPLGTGLTGGRIDWNGTIPAGQVLTWTWVTTHTGGYRDVIANTAQYGHSDSGAAGSARAVFQVIGAPALSLGKSVSPDADVTYHGEVTYTVALTNAGPSDAAGVLLSDTLPAGVTFARWVASPLGTGLTGGRIDWNGTIPAGQVLTWSWVTTHTGGYGDVIANTAQYGHSDSGAAGSARAVFQVIGAPALSLGKSVSPDADVTYHGEVTYTVALTNAGPSDAAGVLLSDTLPAGVTFARWVASPLGTGLTDGRIDWNGTIPAGQTLTWSWVTTHTGGYGDVIANTARCAHPDSGSVGSAEADFRVLSAPALSFGKRVTPATGVVYHGEVTYTVALFNPGPSDAVGVWVSDTLPVGVTFARWVEAPSGSAQTGGQIVWSGQVATGETLTWTWVATHTGHYGDVVTNTARFAHPASASTGSAEAAFHVTGTPLLSLGKSVSPDVKVTYHGEVTYTVALTNAGPPDAVGVLLSDTLPAGVTFARWVASPSGTSLTGGRIDWAGMAPAGQTLTWSWVMTHTGSYGDVIANTAQFTHAASGAAGSAGATFRVDGAPVLSFSKSAWPTVNVATHAEVTYTLTLTNAGSSDAAGVWVSDTLPAGVSFARWAESPAGTTESAGRIDWNGTVPAGHTLTWSWAATHTGTTADVITNTAVFAHAPSGTSGTAQAAFRALRLVAPPDLRLVKAVEPATNVAYHGIVTYTLVASNNGPSDATGVWLTDTLPSQVTLARWVESPAGTTESGGQIKWNGTIGAGATITWTFFATHTGNYGESVHNTVELFYPDGNTGRQAQASFQVKGKSKVYLPVVVMNRAG